MLAVDTCEPAIIRALQKEGWQVVKKPFAINYGNTFVYADLKLSREEQEIIVVEIKCFSSDSSEVSEFHLAVGQYISYRTAMQVSQQEVPIFLAIPMRAYDTFISINPVTLTIIQQNMVHLIVVDLVEEVVQQWIT